MATCVISSMTRTVCAADEYARCAITISLNAPARSTVDTSTPFGTKFAKSERFASTRRTSPEWIHGEVCPLLGGKRVLSSTDARFVLPPKLYLDTIRETLAELRQLGREVKSSNANSFWAFNSRFHQRPALAVVELGGFTRRLAVDQAARPFRIEAQDPIADDLKPDAADPRRIRAPAAVIDLCQGNKPTACPASFEALAKRRRSEASKSSRKAIAAPMVNLR